MMEIPLGELLPDLGVWNNPGLIVARNCYPVPGGYAPFRAAVGSGDTTTEPVRGAALFYKNDGTQLIAFGSSTYLGIRTAGGVTETSGYTSIGSTNVWRFARFDDYVIAVSLANAPQYLTDIDTDTSFSALTGSPPKAAVVGRIGNQLFLGNLNESSTDIPHRIRWGALNNPTASWATDAGELADFRDLPPEYGPVTGIVGGRWGLVFQERAIWRVTFVGYPLVWDFQPVSEGKGCIAPDSIVEIGPETFFLSQDGYYKTDGSGVYGISDGKVSNALLTESQPADLKRVAAAVDWKNRCIVWAGPRVSGAASLGRQLIYSLTTDSWTDATVDLQYPVASQIDATTLGDLGTAFPSGLGTITTTAGLPARLGNPEWLPQEQTLAAFIDEAGGGGEFAQFTGASLSAGWQTGYSQLNPTKRQTIRGATGLIDIADLTDGSGKLTITVAVRDSLGGTDRTQSASPAADTFAPFNINGRYASLAMQTVEGAEWTKAQAIQLEFAQGGRR